MALDPTGPEAQELLRAELSKPPYVAAQPTWFDRLSKSFLDWLGSLSAPAGDGLGGWIPLVAVVLGLAAVTAAWLIYGPPRLNRRSRLGTELFGEHDERSAEVLRRAAATAAAAGRWDQAIAEMFRALARGLVERTVLTLSPGTTAHAFGELAAAGFESERQRLADAAKVFDAVRYLGSPGSQADYLALEALERELRHRQPLPQPMPMVVAGPR